MVERGDRQNIGLDRWIFRGNNRAMKANRRNLLGRRFAMGWRLGSSMACAVECLVVALTMATGPGGMSCAQESGRDTVLRVGMAQLDITPPVGMRLCGTFKERLSTGTHDPLMVRAIVFSQAPVTFAIAGCDLAMISPAIAAQARTSIASACGIRPENVLIHGSETHNGPDYFGEFREAFHRQALAEHGHDPAEPGDFPRSLAERIASAVCRAHENLRPATLSRTRTRCDGIAFYRRFRMADGSIGWNPGKLNPNIIDPSGPTDPTVPVIAIHYDDREAPAGILTGFAMHLAILNDSEYGADYPFYIARRLRQRVTPAPFVHFMQAPCCEVNHVDVSHNRPQNGHPWAEYVGEKLADAVYDALTDLSPVNDLSLAVRTKTIMLALRQYPPDEVARQREIWFGGERQGVEFLELVHAATVSGIYDRHEGGPVPVLLQAFRLNAETAFVGLPSEVSVEFGLHIKRHSPFRHTVVVQLSNDWIGYIPPKRVFEEGNYEAVVSKVRPGEGERLADEAIKLLHELR